MSDKTSSISISLLKNFHSFYCMIVMLQLKLKELRSQYEQRKSSQRTATIAELNQDLEFLRIGQVAAAERYAQVLKSPNSSTEKLKEAAWDAHEYQELLQQAQHLLGDLEETTGDTLPRPLRDEMWRYLKNLYKKKRTAASHVLVIMVAEEQRTKKPYALPVQYVPYASIRDQELRDVLADVKTVMTNMGMSVVGKDPLHLYI